MTFYFLSPSQTLKYAFQTHDRLCFVMEYANGGEVSYFFQNLCLLCLFTCAWVSSFLLFELFWELQRLISFSHWHCFGHWNMGSECNSFWPVWKQQSHSTSFFFKAMGITSLADFQYLCLMRTSRLRRINLRVLQKCREMRIWHLQCNSTLFSSSSRTSLSVYIYMHIRCV